MKSSLRKSNNKKQEQSEIVNAVKQMKKGIKMKNVVKFSLNVLSSAVKSSGSQNYLHSNEIIDEKGYIDLVKVLEKHAGDPEICKQASEILLNVNNQNQEEEKLNDKLVECGLAESLELCSSVNPELKDIETKQLFQENLKCMLDNTTGVLNSIAYEKSQKILGNLQDVNDSEANRIYDKKQMDLLNQFNAKNTSHLQIKDVQKVLKVTRRNKQNKEVLQSVCNFLNIWCMDLTSTNQINIFELVESFGDMNIDLKIFNEQNLVINKVATENDVKIAVKNIETGKNIGNSFWVLAHLIKYPIVTEMINSEEFNKIEQKVLEQINIESNFNEHYAEIVGFMFYLGCSHEKATEAIIGKSKLFFEKLFNILQNLDGNKRELGQLLVKMFLDKYERVLDDLGIVKNIQEWIKDSKKYLLPELVFYTNFSKDCCKSSILHKSILNHEILYTVLEKVEAVGKIKFKECKVFLEFQNDCLNSEESLKKFIMNKNGMKRAQIVYNSTLDKDFDDFLVIDFIEKIYGFQDAFKSLVDVCLKELIYIFANLIENRCFKYLADWSKNFNKTSIWNHDYMPINNDIDLIKNISKLNVREKKIHEIICNTLSLQQINNELNSIVSDKGQNAENLEWIDYFCASIICILQLESNQQDEKCFREIVNLIEKISSMLFQNKEYVCSRHDNSKVLSRSAVMWTCILPYMNSTVALKRLCQNNFSGLKGLSQFLQVSINKDFKWACNCMISFYLFEISVPKDVIKTMSALKENETFNDASVQNMVAMHVSLLNAKPNNIEKPNKTTINAQTLFLHKNETDNELSNCLIKSMNKSQNVIKENQVYSTFVGFLSLKFCARSNMNVIKRSLENQFYEKLIQKFQTANFDIHYAISVAYLLDEWIVFDKTLAQKIHFMNAQDILLHYSKEYYSHEILQHVINPLQKKLADMKDKGKITNRIYEIIKYCNDFIKIIEGPSTDQPETIPREFFYYLLVELNSLILIDEESKNLVMSQGFQEMVFRILEIELKKTQQFLFETSSIVDFLELNRVLCYTASSLFSDYNKNDYKEVWSKAYVIQENLCKNWSRDEKLFVNGLRLCNDMLGPMENGNLIAESAVEQTQLVLTLKTFSKNKLEKKSQSIKNTNQENDAAIREVCYSLYRKLKCGSIKEILQLNNKVEEQEELIEEMVIDDEVEVEINDVENYKETSFEKVLEENTPTNKSQQKNYKSNSETDVNKTPNIKLSQDELSKSQEKATPDNYKCPQKDIEKPKPEINLNKTPITKIRQTHITENSKPQEKVFLDQKNNLQEIIEEPEIKPKIIQTTPVSRKSPNPAPINVSPAEINITHDQTTLEFQDYTTNITESTNIEIDEDFEIKNLSINNSLQKSKVSSIEKTHEKNPTNKNDPEISKNLLNDFSNSETSKKVHINKEPIPENNKEIKNEALVNSSLLDDELEIEYLENRIEDLLETYGSTYNDLMNLDFMVEDPMLTKINEMKNIDNVDMGIYNKNYDSEKVKLDDLIKEFVTLNKDTEKLFNMYDDPVCKKYKEQKQSFESDFVRINCDIQSIRSENECLVDEIGHREKIQTKLDLEITERDSLIKLLENKINEAKKKR